MQTDDDERTSTRPLDRPIEAVETIDCVSCGATYRNRGAALQCCSHHFDDRELVADGGTDTVLGEDVETLRKRLEENRRKKTTTDLSELNRCPECYSQTVNRRSNGGDQYYRCKDCLATFEEPLTGIDRTTSEVRRR